ncbi:glycoside hydrolase family 3 protein [Streptomyces albipurpureus]|uniref:Glycoside hydrolase family 3 C-terminal domain-containing protein n=1 Tax=Streptomyces albipurpureus TaxID=2897419 RepID=A0ABT0V0A5_9ACTN|nr:glycoside hydrolase family 3 C-terminal domain-containing protein [Streptomyces sp. CWNU-1]MCM2394156.1 glycoside hydrolase family 3 C-terminal domain-containing protein [Streptomyces sp. CWNU-1]
MDRDRCSAPQGRGTAVADASAPAPDYIDAIESALGKLDLDAKARLLAGQDVWSLPALPEIGLESLVMSDGPIGVRGTQWSADDPSIALPSPTALAATWDPSLARRAGRLLAQEARRKGVHVLLAPTVNLHRSPVGGRHFECYSEDPYLTGEIGTGYVAGVQDGGVGTTVKHFVANDAETDRFTVNNVVAPRPLRELYLAPFEAIVKNAHPWGIMAAYNQVNGSTMTEHRYLQNAVLRGEWGFDGYIVSDWLAARSTRGAITGGLDVAMPGPQTVYGEALAAAVRSGEVEESDVDGAVRNVLRLAARVGVLEGAGPAVTELPATIDGRALAHEIARRSFVLLGNNPVAGGDPVLPIDPTAVREVALIGAAARDARVLGGGSATVFPEQIVSPLDGLAAALPDGVLTHTVGADPSDELSPAGKGFTLSVRCRDQSGRLLGESGLPTGHIQWIGDDLPAGVTHESLHSLEILGTLTPRESGEHTFGTRGLGAFRLTVDGEVLWAGGQPAEEASDPFEAFFGKPAERARVQLTAGEPVEVSLSYTVPEITGAPMSGVVVSLLHQEPVRAADELIAEAVLAARSADVAVVVVATTESVESEGFDREDLRLPGRQDDLVRAVVAVNPRTVVVVNAGSPVELPWRDDVAAVLLSWFPGQEGGAALADVLLGAAEPGGRLPTTWPAVFADAPVSQVVPESGELDYREGLFIGYRAYDKAGTTPAYAFGHGLGYTTWEYESLEVTPGRAAVRIRNTGSRTGREIVQIYLAPTSGGEVERPARWLAGFASVEAAAGSSVEVEIELPPRAFEIWDEQSNSWAHQGGFYQVQAAHALDDQRLTATLEV